jgi:branched-chain amino acid transport system substrate-binding protein
MSHAFGDERLEQQLRGILDERAEEVAAHARTSAEIAAELAPRLRGSARSFGVADRTVRLVAVAAVLAALLGYLAFAVGRPHPPIRLLLAADMPLGAETGVETVIDGIRLALARDGADDRGFAVELPDAAVLSDASGGTADANRGAANATSIVDDGRYVALIGPYNSFVAEAEIPIANAAGMLQCSPANTAPNLTVGPSAVALGPHADRPTYVRVAATDDAQAAGAAQFLVKRLGAHSIYVVSVPGFAGDRATGVVAAIQRIGGTVTGASALTGDPDVPAIVQAIERARPDAVFYDGPGGSGATVIRGVSAVVTDLPFVSLDGILDGPPSTAGTFLNAAGPAAGNAYALFPASLDRVRALEVTAAEVAAHGRRPARFEYGGYACAEIILAALADLNLPPSATVADWREALRREVTESGRTWQTVLGDFSFDPNGDPVPARVSVYRFDTAVGDWAFSEVVELPASP